MDEEQGCAYSGNQTNRAEAVPRWSCQSKVNSLIRFSLPREYPLIKTSHRKCEGLVPEAKENRSAFYLSARSSTKVTKIVFKEVAAKEEMCSVLC